MKKISAQKGIVHFPILLVILAVVGLAIWFFLNKGGLGSNGVKVQIPPSQLMPFVSAVEARTTICNLKKEGLFAEACQEKFKATGKDDSAKLAELFTLINKIQNDKNLSDYHKLLLGQLVFAVLPNKDSPQTSGLQSSLLGVVYAQEAGNNLMGEAEFKDLMTRDLQGVIDIRPKENNAWTIIVMVSKYSWVDGERQPIYSKQWARSFDPFPNNPNVNEADIAYRTTSIVGNRATSQNIYNGSFQGSGEMITYSFTMMSWKSQEYANGDRPTLDDFHQSELNFSEEGYQGENYLSLLLGSVRTPRPELPIKSTDEQSAQTKGSKNVTCEEFKKIGEGNEDYKNLGWVHIEDWEGSGSHAYWFEKEGRLFDNSDYDHPKDVYKDRPPDYLISSPEWDKCNQGLQ